MFCSDICRLPGGYREGIHDDKLLFQTVNSKFGYKFAELKIVNFVTAISSLN